MLINFSNIPENPEKSRDAVGRLCRVKWNSVVSDDRLPKAICRYHGDGPQQEIPLKFDHIHLQISFIHDVYLFSFLSSERFVVKGSLRRKIILRLGGSTAVAIIIIASK